MNRSHTSSDSQVCSGPPSWAHLPLGACQSSRTRAARLLSISTLAAPMPSKSDARANLGVPGGAVLIRGAWGAGGARRCACTQRMLPVTSLGNAMGSTLAIPSD
eukprot:2243188-Pyramimonas_sp.AAC.2